MQVDYHYNKIKSYYSIRDQIFETIQRNFECLSEFRINRTIQWIHVYNITSPMPIQGWKIHVSATHMSAVEILKSVVKVLIDEKLNFKVADTINTLKVMNDAHYPRAYSGKFITIYPSTEEQFVRVTDKIHRCTCDFRGPIILSDKQYKDGIVFYRYGAFKGIQPAGSTKLYIMDESNNLVEDVRNAWFSPPYWVTDPFDNCTSPTVEQDTLTPIQKIKLLYSIRHANKGGVYVAEKSDGVRVILKEARKYVSTDDNGFDVSDYLQNEYRILLSLRNKEYAPKVFDFLETANSSFLIEEFIEGKSLPQYIDSLHKSFNPHNDIDSLLSITKSLIETVVDIHKNGIILRDLSKNNIIVTDDTTIKIIDFDISYIINDRIYAPKGGTEGYFYKERNSDVALVADDIYSIGCVLFFIFTNRDPFFLKNKQQSTYSQQIEYLRAVGHAKQIPAAIIDLILKLLNPNFYNKLDLGEIKDSVQHIQDTSKTLPELCINQKHFCETVFLENIASYIVNQIDFSKENILPTSINGQKMSPACIQTGAAGIGQLVIELNKMGLISNEFLHLFVKWIHDHYYHQYDDSEHPLNDFSLYFGISGVLWFLLDAADYMQDKALSDKVQSLFIKIIKPSQLYNDIVLGNAGYGMTAIHFYKKTNKKIFLDIAQNLAETICDNAQKTQDVISWPLDNEVYWGFAHGYAGICHFFNVLFTITGNNKYIEIANNICDILISNAIVEKGCASWNFGPNNNKKWSHWCNGSSGIGSALIRMYLTTQNKKYLNYAELAAKNVYNGIWNSSMCQCHGVCGDAEFLYDMYCITHDPIYLSYIDNINEYIYSSRIDANGMDLLLDETKLRISADWGTGLSGVGTYIVRLINRTKERLYMNDDILYNFLLVF